jgi:hypothetical protein
MDFLLDTHTILCGHILIGDDIHKRNNFEYVGRFEVLTAVSNGTAAFWNELPWSSGVPRGGVWGVQIPPPKF